MIRIRLNQVLRALAAATGIVAVSSVTVTAHAQSTTDAVENPFAQVRSSGVQHQSNVDQGVAAQPGAVQPAANAQDKPVLPGQAAPEPAQQAPAPHPPTGNVAVVGEGLPTPKLDEPQIDYQKEVLSRLAPADAEQLRAIMQELYRRQGAQKTPLDAAGVTCRTTQYAVDLSPGATPPVVRVAKGIGASVSFTDAAGNPWPATFANNFYAEAQTAVQIAPHVFSVGARSPHLSGSMVVMLKDLPTPVTFVVTPAQEMADCRVDLRIPGLAPGAVATPGAIDGRPSVGSEQLTGFLYGGTPAGAERLRVRADPLIKESTRAWQSASGRLVLRTNAQVISPGWYQRLPTMDGTAVYELPPTSRVRASIDGNPLTIVVEGLTPKIGQASTSKLAAQ